MTRDEAIRALKAIEPEARALGVTALYLFGSTARGEAGPESDLDLLFDYDRSRLAGFAVIGVRDFFEDRLGVPVDAVTVGGLHPLVRPQIERRKVRVF